MDEESQSIFLSWQGNVTGPHSLHEVRHLLRTGAIHSLYKVQAGEKWLLLREHLTKTNRIQQRALAKVAKEKANTIPLPLPTDFEDNDFILKAQEDEATPLMTPTIEDSATLLIRTNNGQAKKMASVSMALSLCFFIPVINGITQILSLLFGHQAISLAATDDDEDTHNLALTSLWITYLQIGFLAVSMLWFSSTQSSSLQHTYLMMHGHMFGVGIFSWLGAKFLMRGIEMVTDEHLSFLASFTATLLPSTINILGLLLIGEHFSDQLPNTERIIAAVTIFQCFMFVMQMLYWSTYITLTDNEDLGMSSAAVVSLFYSMICIPIGILYVIKLTSASS